MFQKALNSLNRFCSKISEGSNSQYFNFSIYGFFNTIIPYMLWHDHSHDSLSLVLHSFSIALCVFLFFYKYWPQNFKKYLQTYWCFTLFYCLPFLSTYTLFINNLIIGWTINSVLALFLLSFLVNWLGFIIILGIGVISGWCIYWFYGGCEHNIVFKSSHLVFIGYTYISAIIIGGIFARKRNEYNADKEQYLKLIGGAIAHELRTPLMVIAMNIKAIRNNFDSTEVELREYNGNYSKQGIKIFQSIERIEKTTKESFNIIDMLLMNSKDTFDRNDFSILSMHRNIKDAIDSYPFSETQNPLVIWNKESDFNFIGSETLIRHVLFNLFKNALYSIKEANKGSIIISESRENTFNILHIKDTGKGMPRYIKDRIFDKFYSKTKHGTGIGLSFCSLVMEAFNGYIECNSEEGEFTEFLLFFPIIVESADE